MTVLLLHAFPLDERMWELQRPVLEGHDVIAPRLYGRGSTMNAWAESIAAETDGELAVVGASMGGMIAQMVAIRQYERQAAAVRETARLAQVVQLQGLAAAALSIGASLSVEDALRVLTEQARAIIAVHLSVARLWPDPDRRPALPTISVSADSTRYPMAAERPVDVSPLFHIRAPTRMTRAQIDADPAWREWRPFEGGAPPQGWLAARRSSASAKTRR